MGAPPGFRRLSRTVGGPADTGEACVAVPDPGRGRAGQSCRRDEDQGVTATQSPPNEQPTTAGARPYATINPYTGEVEKEFPFLESDAIDGVVEKAHAAFLEWRRRPV